MNIIQKPDFDSVLVKKENGHLFFESVCGYETRNQSTIRLIELTDQRYNLSDFNWVVINTGDQDICKTYQGLKVFSYSTSSGDYDLACPDFTFDHWRQVGMDDYETICVEIAKVGDEAPETNMLGWRGARTHPLRDNLVQLHDNTNLDVEYIEWNRSNPDKLTCVNHVSLPDHPKKWRYLIDVEGTGWSARLKLLMFSKRVLFIPDRPFKEWFFPHMIPWKHFVPCKRDMSDLIDNLNIIKQDEVLETKIRHSAFEFARMYLSRDACLARWKFLLNGH